MSERVKERDMEEQQSKYQCQRNLKQSKKESAYIAKL